MSRRSFALLVVLCLVAFSTGTSVAGAESFSNIPQRLISATPILSLSVDGELVLYTRQGDVHPTLLNLMTGASHQIVTYEATSPCTGTPSPCDGRSGPIDGKASISGRFIAYVARTGGNSKDDVATLFLQNLDSGERSRLVTNSQYLHDPIMAGGKILFVSGLQGDAIISLYDIASGSVKTLTTLKQKVVNTWRMNFTWKTGLLFDGRYVVWTETIDPATKDWPYVQERVVALDTVTGTKSYRPAIRDKVSLWATGMDQRRVVYYQWAEAPDGQWVNTVRLWDLSADTDIELTTVHRGPSPQSPAEYPLNDPTIHGNQVTWISYELGNGYNVYVHDLRTGETRQVSTDTNVKENLLLTDRHVLYNIQNAAGKADKLMAAPLYPLPDRVKLLGATDIVEPAPTFPDLPREHWAAPSVSRVAAAGLLRGYPDGRFGPDNPITRAEFIKVLIQAYPQNVPMGESFSDVPPNHWAYAVIHQARSRGLVTGYQNQFNPDQPISRAEMAVMLQRVLKLSEPLDPVTFSDIPPSPTWASGPISTLASYQLLTGLPSGGFGPFRTATRAEAGVLLARLLK